MPEKLKIKHIALVFFSLLILAVISYYSFDLRTALWIRAHLSPKMIKIFEALTLPIEPLLIPSYLLLIFILSSKGSLFLKTLNDFATSTLFNLGIVPIIKALFPRPRPSYFLSHGLYQIMPFQFLPEFISMPSGHASGAGLLCGFIYLYTKGRKRLFMLVPVVFMTFRILCLKHFPSDCLVGFAIGFCLVLIFHKRSEAIINRIKGLIWKNGKIAL